MNDGELLRQLTRRSRSLECGDLPFDAWQTIRTAVEKRNVLRGTAVRATQWLRRSDARDTRADIPPTKRNHRRVFPPA
ncbi:hypothetical protein C488_14277 [Natrinema pellirubrum DSM 15624]|uniref:Uncharacterized protein n=1 Tax=Natrinema pellirubrum (strain DSM 15624 / CIP 106293 / JCM 10476 / NCIMB 786 / 157) TaxID=797303 RepID=L9YH72_NATP1|nr:hypothetical protein [Natrinema pellirubrum]ELY73016.1 hypothetical protein C488_14277 [Natrinema pellirubrum DSM 15624]